MAPNSCRYGCPAGSRAPRLVDVETDGIDLGRPQLSSLVAWYRVMRIRFAGFAAILSVIGFLAWLLVGQPGRSLPEDPLAGSGHVRGLQERPDGSTVACAVPLTWRIARVDEEFGLSTAQATHALQQAAALWEEAVGRPLFAHDSIAGSPIRFVYDERQARTRERRRVEEESDKVSERLEAWRAELDALSERLSRVQTDYAHRVRDLQQRVTSHNAIVRGWNERGGAPAEARAELHAAERALEAERLELTEQQRELEALQREFLDERERFGRKMEEHQRQRDAAEEAFPTTRVESGGYREAVRTQNGRIVSVSREIRIYRFDGPNELLRILAHELGHALGLGHTAVPGTVMSEEFRHARSSGVVPRIQPADTELLRSRCPNL